jgi:hypothetical protein
MQDEEITALAKGMAPFIREYVDQAICRMMLIPPELAEQVANAVRLLHEAPPIDERKEIPQRSSLPRLTRIERDANGNFVPVYGELPK